MGSVSDTLWAAEVRPDGSHGSPYWSPNVEALTGRPAAAFGQDPDGWLAIVCEEDRPLVRAMRGRLAAGLAEHEQAEYRVVLPDGRERWLRDSVSASRGPGGGVQLSGVLSDITAARETERLSRERDTQAAAAKRDERFRSLIENASDVVVVLDEAGAVLYASPSVETVLGFRADAVVGHAAFDAVLPEDRGELLRGLEAVAARPGSAAPLRARIRDPRGVVRVIEGTARNLSHKPEVGGIVVNGRDVTERDQLEVQLRQAQKMDAVGQLAGGVAHDFNNLLGVINGYGDLLLREVPPDHPWVARVLQIKKAADRAGDLTRQLLAFSRKQVQRLQLLDLNTMVGSVAQMLARLIGEDVRVTTVLSPRIGRVRADPTQIEQVVMNLALNARDAMPLGGTLTIETGEVDLDDAFLEGHAGASPGRHVALTVSDTGHGMDEQTQARIFEPFFTTKTEGRGTGLGLATVYGIVKQSHGYITVSSAPGRGTTFRVYLPRAADAAAAAGAQPAAAPMPLPRGSETVLLVEDDPQLRSLLREILSGAGYRVLEAAQPEDAIAASSAHPGALDVLLTDVIMPTMSGREVADAVCAARPAVKVLYMSGYTNDVLGRHHALDPGIDLLEKPFSAYSVLSRLRAVLDA
jgi:two-component system cell cycle sensor histidine kinase/response regulator CckA